MILYTINNVYPDKNFNFTLNANNMGFAPVSHKHAVDEVEGLADALDAKAQAEHSHTGVYELYNGSRQDPSTYEGGAFSIAATGTATVSVSGGTTANGMVHGGTVTINYNSPQTNRIGGMLEKNPDAARKIVQFYTGSLADSAIDDPTLVVLTLEDNQYA